MYHFRCIIGFSRFHLFIYLLNYAYVIFSVTQTPNKLEILQDYRFVLFLCAKYSAIIM